MDKLKYYLGTGLKFELIDPKFETGEYELSSIDLLGYVSLNGINVKTQSTELFHFEDVQFKMRPLSSLTKEITVEGYNGGKPFVPVDHLFSSKYQIEKHKSLGTLTKRDIENMKFFWQIQKLISWHFWLFDQTEFGKSLIEIKD